MPADWSSPRSGDRSLSGLFCAARMVCLPVLVSCLVSCLSMAESYPTAVWLSIVFASLASSCAPELGFAFLLAGLVTCARSNCSASDSRASGGVRIPASSIALKRLKGVLFLWLA